MRGVKGRRFMVLFKQHSIRFYENVRMIMTKRISVISQWKTFIRVLPTRWRWKPAGIETTSLSPYVYSSGFGLITGSARVCWRRETAAENRQKWRRLYRFRRLPPTATPTARQPTPSVMTSMKPPSPVSSSQLDAVARPATSGSPGHR